jgi:hypothetical protein
MGLEGHPHPHPVIPATPRKQSRPRSVGPVVVNRVLLMGRGLREANSGEGPGLSWPRGMHGELVVKGQRSQGDGWYGTLRPPRPYLQGGLPATSPSKPKPKPFRRCCQCDFWAGSPDSRPEPQLALFPLQNRGSNS